MTVKYVINSNEENKNFFVRSEQDSPTLYFSFLPQYAAELKKQNKGIIFTGSNFIIGLVGDLEKKEMITDLEKLCKDLSSKQVKTALKD